jgi:hypothetical protein
MFQESCTSFSAVCRGLKIRMVREVTVALSVPLNTHSNSALYRAGSDISWVYVKGYQQPKANRTYTGGENNLSLLIQDTLTV